MVEALTLLQCAALVALILAALAATRWFWKSAPVHRKRGLADKPSPVQEEAPPYVVVRPGAPKRPEKQKAWLKP